YLRAAAQAQQCIRLLESAGIYAARPVELETPPDRTHAASQQRRGERVTPITREGTVVEPKRQGAPAVERVAGTSCRRKPVGTRASHRAGLGSPIRYTVKISCVVVSRATLNQRPQPKACSQRS